MKQPEGFFFSDDEHLVCKLKKSIYDLKQASQQWYFKFHDVIYLFELKENIMINAYTRKISGSKTFFSCFINEWYSTYDQW